MAADLILAIAHHLLIVGLIVMMATEAARLRPGLNGEDLAALARMDAGYGATAGLIVVVGALRVVFGIKGYHYYLPNPWFWGKMVAFGAIGLLSVPPTLALLKWKKAQLADPGFTPADAEIARARRFVLGEIGLLPVVVACAAAMARLG